MWRKQSADASRSVSRRDNSKNGDPTGQPVFSSFQPPSGSGPIRIKQSINPIGSVFGTHPRLAEKCNADSPPIRRWDRNRFAYHGGFRIYSFVGISFTNLLQVRGSSQPLRRILAHERVRKCACSNFRIFGHRDIPGSLLYHFHTVDEKERLPWMIGTQLP